MTYWNIDNLADISLLLGRTIIDAASFKEFNANYSSIDMDPSDPEFFGRRFHAHDRRLQNQSNLKKKALQPEEVTDEEACLCSPTVQGFSLSKRMWGKLSWSWRHLRY